MDIIRAQTEKDFQLIAELASAIWKEHYIPIIGVEQVDYMLDKFQSQEAIKQQTQEGAEYYLINYQDIAACYFAYTKKKESLFLSKLYVLKSYRGKKIGKTALLFIENKAIELECKNISLTVNKNNTHSISAYEKMGYQKKKPIKIDIGNGFVMDDFLMEKEFY